ncbi:MAG: cysteine--tRNA ligase [Pseudomonadota bacterium]
MADVQLYNTMTRRKEALVPVIPGQVSLYVCGPTVYDRAHLGNARPAIVFDTLVRLLRHAYGAGNVRYVRNITDVEDKIIARAAERGVEIGALTAETERWYLEDMAAVGVAPPDDDPHATAYIPQMVAMIETLAERGHAYAAEGHVLFSVASHDGYGRLSGRSVDDMIAGARVEVAPYKRDPMDFVLWKPSDPDQPGWEGPMVDGVRVGRGRPGWHIECSAMADALLGETFDIHGGGNDLMFPHHENELAQSACAHPDGGFARIWMHNEMLQVEGKKMSKSLGNFFTVRDLLDKGVPGEVIRLVMLGTHYRKPMDWTAERARAAEGTLRKWWALTRGQAPGNVHESVLAALADDLNTPGAIAELHKLAAAGATPDLLASARLLGLLTGEMAGWEEAGPASEADQAALHEMAQWLERARDAAKLSKDFSEVDRLKAELTQAGIEVRMSKSGIELVPGPDFDADALQTIGRNREAQL